MSESMNAEQKKEYGRKQKAYLTKIILEYQWKPIHTAESLRGKTLKQLERICEKEGI